MASVKVNVGVSAPQNLEIRLVREDHLQTSNIFRIGFEFFLMMIGVLLGKILTIPDNEHVSKTTWLFLITMIVGGLCTLWQACSYYKKAKSENITP